MFLKKLFGTSSTRYIKKISPEIKKINDFYDGLSSKSDQDLVDRTNELKKIISDSRDVIKSQFEILASFPNNFKRIFIYFNFFVE